VLQINRFNGDICRMLISTGELFELESALVRAVLDAGATSEGDWYLVKKPRGAAGHDAAFSIDHTTFVNMRVRPR
jgi:hypothetical protein